MYFPKGQEVQRAWLEAKDLSSETYFPAGQIKQRSSESWRAGSVALSERNLPAGQALQSRRLSCSLAEVPVSELYEPAGQMLHVTELAEAEYSPAPQVAQAADSTGVFELTERLPASHGVQAVEDAPE